MRTEFEEPFTGYWSGKEKTPQILSHHQVKITQDDTDQQSAIWLKVKQAIQESARTKWET
ncbi:hypothetical protein [Bacillus sp. FJAT-45037]|uniref:hypothetical protein n=1 Tax=Bacillus sp. FJAT-45037 TaxID=2011007 RepID=UPI000C24E65A|nr:hypothetical protein [Bacillus sp. FJAT-45037]